MKYQWEKVTQKELENCIRWCQNKLNLRDWEITLDTNNEVPEAFGKTDKETIGRTFSKWHRLRSLMWISLNRLKQCNQNPFETVIHEMLHILCNVVDISPEDEEDNIDGPEECLVFRLESPLFKLFCLETGRKLPEELEDYWDSIYE